jgi:hypothetical protein
MSVRLTLQDPASNAKDRNETSYDKHLVILKKITVLIYTSVRLRDVHATFGT